MRGWFGHNHSTTPRGPRIFPADVVVSVTNRHRR
jgi:hypothetical protein